MDEPVARDIGADAVCEPEHRISTDKSAWRIASEAFSRSRLPVFNGVR
jgi:hypothetical protein